MNEEGLLIVALNTLALKCNAYAVNQGFWGDEDKLRDMIKFLFEENLCDDSILRDRTEIIQRLFNSEKIALEMTELAERLETLRKDPKKQDEHCPNFLNLEIECADLIIRCLDFCGRRHIRIGEAIIAKMKYNETREFKHGKNF